MRVVYFLGQYVKQTGCRNTHHIKKFKKSTEIVAKSRNFALCKEIVGGESNDIVRNFTDSSEIAVSAHAQ